MSDSNDTPRTIEIPLGKNGTRGVVTIDECDADLAGFKWSPARNTRYTTYATCSELNGRSMHRIILERKVGRPLDKKELCDHADGNGLNNRRDNLRVATAAQNQHNRPGYKTKAATSTYRGVSRSSRNRWTSQVTVSGKRVYLGTFSSEEEAHAAYCEAVRKYFGEFARFE